jgi:hypothetical protein
MAPPPEAFSRHGFSPAVVRSNAIGCWVSLKVPGGCRGFRATAMRPPPASPYRDVQD